MGYISTGRDVFSAGPRGLFSLYSLPHILMACDPAVGALCVARSCFLVVGVGGMDIFLEVQN